MINFPNNSLSKHYHFDSFPYENSYEEEEFVNKPTFNQLSNLDNWYAKYQLPTSNLEQQYYPNKSSAPIGFQPTSSNYYHTNISPNSKRKKILTSFKNLIALSNKLVKPTKKETLIARLPCEILVQIVGYLSYKDVRSIILVCKEWYYVGIEEILWKMVFRTHFQMYPNHETPLSKSSGFVGLPDVPDRGSQHWKELFNERLQTEMRWRNGQHKDSMLIGHTGTVWNLKKSGDTVFTCSFDKTAKVWDFNTRKCHYTMVGHYYPVQCLDTTENDNLLVTGSLDNSIRVWNLSKKRCEGILTNHAHNFDVFCMQFKDERYLVSGSSDSTVKIWDIQDIYERSGNNLTNTIHNNHVNENNYNRDYDDDANIDQANDNDRDYDIVDHDQEHNVFNNNQHIDDNQQQQQFQQQNINPQEDQEANMPEDDPYNDSLNVTIASKNYRNQVNAQALSTFKHMSCVTCLQVQDNLILSGGSDKVVRSWDANTGQDIAILQGHKEGIRCLQFEDNVLITGSNDSTAKIWDLRLNRCVATLRGHEGSVRCLHMRGSTLMTGSNDQTIKIWNLSYHSTNTASTSNSSKKPQLAFQDVITTNSSIGFLKFNNENLLMYGQSDSKVKFSKFI